MAEKDMEFLDSIDIWKFKNIITSSVPIIELLGEYGIKPIPMASSGQFSHKTFCLFHKGRDGHTEKTPSLYISQNTNSFYCFGCSVGGSIIELIQFLDGTPKIEVLKKLAKRIGLIDKDGNFDELKVNSVSEFLIFEDVKNIEPLLFDINVALRSYVMNFVDSPNFDAEFKWMEKLSYEIDFRLKDIGYEEYDKVFKLFELANKKIKNRLNKIKGDL